MARARGGSDRLSRGETKRQAARRDDIGTAEEGWPARSFGVVEGRIRDDDQALIPTRGRCCHHVPGLGHGGGGLYGDGGDRSRVCGPRIDTDPGP